MKHKRKIPILSWIKMVIFYFMVMITFLLTLTLGWVFSTWPKLSMDELVYTLNAPLEGTGTGMILSYVRVCLLPAIILTLGTGWLLKLYKKRHLPQFGKIRFTAVILMAVVLICDAGFAWKRLDVKKYLSLRGQYSDFIENEYVNPANVDIKFPDRKRNLIYIFLESMEITYSDQENGGAFETDCIPELTQLAEKNEDFSGTDSKLNGASAVGGTTWTMGAMFGQTAGLPLNLSIDGNSMNTQDSFFEGITTLGDILADQGYSQTLLIGSDATFGGRRLYFTEHGNYDIFDYNYALDTGLLPEGYGVWWGYEDEKLFEYARQKLTDLSMQNQPFNLTMLTVDTHFEDGYVCDLCRDDFGDNQYANVMACSSRQVSAFIKWIQDQSFYDNTTIVVVGDHPTMDSDFCSGIDGSYQRKVYTCYINAAVKAENQKREYTTFDHFPTTLAALGAEIPGNRLGLGVNLFSDTPTLLETYGLEKLSTEAWKRSRLLDHYADIDEEAATEAGE